MSEDKDPKNPEMNENSPENDASSKDAPTDAKDNLVLAEENPEVPSSTAETPESENISEEVVPEVTDENWEKVLDEEYKNIPADEVKRRKAELKKQAKAKKQQELDEKARKLLDQQFTNIFNPKVLPYTIAFFILIGISAVLSLAFNNIPGILWIQITLTLTGILGFFILFQLSRIDRVHDTLFADGKILLKILFMALCFLLAFLIVWIYWTITESGLDPTTVPENASTTLTPFPGVAFATLPQALQYTILFSYILQIIYFGWNIIQILFIRQGLENISIKVQTKVEQKYVTSDYESKAKKYGLYNVLLAIIPYILIPLTVWLLLIYPDTREFWAPLESMLLDILKDQAKVDAFLNEHTGKFTPELFFYKEWLSAAIVANPEANFLDYFVEIWWGTVALQRIFVWYLIITGIMIAMTVHQKHLLNESKIHKTPNVFSNMFFMLLWIILWTKSFSLLKNLLMLNNGAILEKQLTTFDLIIDIAMDFILMVITLIMAMRGFGLKFQKGNFKGVSQYNASIVALIFAISYFGGQMVLISTGLTRQDLSFITNFIVLIVDLVFYFWYSKYVMERKGFTRRTSFTLYETKDLLVDLSMQIKEHMLQTIENEETIKLVLNDFLLEKKIALENASKGGKDGIVGDLTRPEEELTADEKVERASDAYKESRIDLDNYTQAVEALTKAREELGQMKAKDADLQKILEKFPNDLDVKCEQSKDELNTSRSKLSQIRAEIEENEKQIDQLEKQIEIAMNPIQPAPEADGTIPPRAVVDQNEVDRLSSEKAEKTKLINSLTSQMNGTQTQIEKQTSVYEALNQKVSELNSTRAAIKDVQVSIGNAETQIDVMEKNLILLEKREVESRPKLAAAEGAKLAAEAEKTAFNETQNRMVLLDEAKQKQTQAEEKLAISDRQMKDADSRLNATTPIPQCEEMIRVAKEKISTRTKLIADTQITLNEKQLVLEEKSMRYNVAKEERDAEKADYETAAGKVMLAEKELEKAQSTFQSGETAKKDLEEAKARANEMDKIKQKMDKPDIIDTKVQELQNREKEQKNTVKELKKRSDAGEIPIDDVDRANEVLEKVRQELGQWKQKGSDSKEAYANYDAAVRKVKSLEEKQIDLKTAKTDLEVAQKNLKVAQDALKAPKAKLDEMEANFVKCSEEMNMAQADRDAEQGRLKQCQIDLQDSETEKSRAEQALADRQNAESQHLAAMKDLEKSQKVVENAKKFVATREFELNEAKESQKLREEDAISDWKIYISHVELRDAQKTFQEALRSAEANLKAREGRLQEAIEEKKKLLELRQVSVEQVQSEEKN